MFKTLISRRPLLLGLWLLVGCCLAAPVLAQSRAVTWQFAEPPIGLPQPPEVAARAFVLQDLASMQTLAARQADQRMDPASMTKLMTAYLIFQAVDAGKLQLQQKWKVSDLAWKTGLSSGLRSHLTVGAEVSVDDLLKGMIVHGGNDATVALAEGLAGSVDAFVERMNRQAQALGLKATQYRNPEGRAVAGHYSTAREVAMVAARLVSDFPQSLPYFSLKEATLGGVKQSSRNLLLWRDPTVDGLQTSYAEGAGYGLAVTSQRTVAGASRRLIAVVVGASSPESRANEGQKLLNWGHASFDVIKLFSANQAVVDAPVWKGASSTVPVGRLQPIMVVVPKGQGGNLKTHLVRQDPLLAPLTRGQTVATLKISLAGQPWQDVPLQALEAVSSAGWFGRAWDAIRLGVQ